MQDTNDPTVGLDESAASEAAADEVSADERATSLDELLGHLAGVLGSADGDEGDDDKDDKDDKDIEIPSLVVSVSEALMLAEHASSGAERRMIARLVLRGGDVSVDVKGLHNFANLYFTSGDNECALRLARFGLARFQNSTTLLGDAIQACAQLGRYEEGMSYVDRALEIGRERWDWYLAVWVASFFKEALELRPASEGEELVKAALDALDSYMACHAFDDRVCNQKAEVLAAVNRMDEAAAVLEEAIFSPQRAPIDKTMTLMHASQCCMTYLQLFGTTAEPRKVGSVARRGYASLAQLHQSADAGTFLLYEAFALDAELCNQTSYEDGFGNKAKVSQLLSAYEAAFCQVGGDDARELIRQRLGVVRGRARIAD